MLRDRSFRMSINMPIGINKNEIAAISLVKRNTRCDSDMKGVDSIFL